MLNNISYIMISINNKEKLLDFYINNLGLELKDPHDPISSLSFPNFSGIRYNSPPYISKTTVISRINDKKQANITCFSTFLFSCRAGVLSPRTMPWLRFRIKNRPWYPSSYFGSAKAVNRFAHRS